MSRDYEDTIGQINENCRYFFEDFPNDDKITMHRYRDAKQQTLSFSQDYEKKIFKNYRESLKFIINLLGRNRNITLTEDGIRELQRLLNTTITTYTEVYNFIDSIKTKLPKDFDAASSVLPTDLVHERINLSQKISKAFVELEKFLSAYRVAILEEDFESLRSTMAGKALERFNDNVYKPQVRTHCIAARRWLSVGIVCSVVIFLLLLSMVTRFPYSTNFFNLSADGSLVDLTKIGLILAVPVYMMLFSFRNYRINRQNQALNNHISMSISTFDFFKESFSNDLELKKSVADKITTLIFQSPDFGYLKEASVPKLLPIQNLIDAAVRAASNKSGS